jgi:16S rRNA (guanine527-N7)-methyltransferase
LDRAQIALFEQYLGALKEWNRVVRLVSSDDIDSIVWLHFYDSLSAYPFVKDARSLLDIGSGAGFPGVPLKIALPNLPLDLVESHRRKAHFLKHLVRHLGLQGVVVNRCRMGSGRTQGVFHTVVARAVAGPAVWLSWAVDLLEEGGQIILMVGPSMDFDELCGLLRSLGLGLHRSIDLELPVVKHRRRIVAVGKQGCFT